MRNSATEGWTIILLRGAGVGVFGQFPPKNPCTGKMVKESDEPTGNSIKLKVGYNTFLLNSLLAFVVYAFRMI